MGSISFGFFFFIAILVGRLVLPAIWALIQNRGRILRRGRVAGHPGPGLYSFKGRAGRAEWAVLFFLASFCAALGSLVPIIGALIYASFLIIVVAVCVRRLNDLGLSRRGQIALAAAAATTLALSRDAARESPLLPRWTIEIDGAETGVVPAVCSVLALLLFGLLAAFPGRAGPNMFGEADDAGD